MDDMAQQLQTKLKEFLQVTRHAMRKLHDDTDRGAYKLQTRVVALLKMQDEITYAQLRYLLDVDSKRLQSVLGKMQSMELVTIQELEGDSSIIALTDKGRIVDDRGAIDSKFIECMSCLNYDEKLTFVETVSKLIVAIQSKFDIDSTELDSTHCDRKHDCHDSDDGNCHIYVHVKGADVYNKHEHKHKHKGGKCKTSDSGCADNSCSCKTSEDTTVASSIDEATKQYNYETVDSANNNTEHDASQESFLDDDNIIIGDERELQDIWDNKTSYFAMSDNNDSEAASHDTILEEYSSSVFIGYDDDDADIDVSNANTVAYDLANTREAQAEAHTDTSASKDDDIFDDMHDNDNVDTGYRVTTEQIMDRGHSYNSLREKLNNNNNNSTYEAKTVVHTPRDRDASKSRIPAGLRTFDDIREYLYKTGALEKRDKKDAKDKKDNQ